MEDGLCRTGRARTTASGTAATGGDGWQSTPPIVVPGHRPSARDGSAATAARDFASPWIQRVDVADDGGAAEMPRLSDTFPSSAAEAPTTPSLPTIAASIISPVNPAATAGGAGHF